MWATVRAGKPPLFYLTVRSYLAGAPRPVIARLLVILSSYQAELFTLCHDKTLVEQRKGFSQRGGQPVTTPMTGNMSSEEVSQSRLAQTRGAGWSPGTAAIIRAG